MGCAPEHADEVLTENVQKKLNRRKCSHPEGCNTIPSFGEEGTKVARFCRAHAKEGMFYVYRKMCRHTGCAVRPSYGPPGSKKAEFCELHAKEGMLNVNTKRCGHPEICRAAAIYGEQGRNKEEFCAQHKRPGMVILRRRSCGSPGYAHAREGMVRICDKTRRTCGHAECTKHPHFAVPGTKQCSLHAKEGMANINSKKCRHPNCLTRPSYGEAGSNKEDYCLQHAREGIMRTRSARPFDDHGRASTVRGARRKKRGASSALTGSSMRKGMGDRKLPRQIAAESPAVVVSVKTEDVFETQS